MILVGEKDVECDDIIITEISAQEPCLDSQSSWVICEQSNERDLWDLSHSEHGQKMTLVIFKFHVCLSDLSEKNNICFIQRPIIFDKQPKEQKKIPIFIHTI